MDAAGRYLVPSATEQYCRRERPTDAVTVSEMSVSRLCIQTDRDGDPVAIDVVLPSDLCVAELLPTIVGLVDDRALPDGAARPWRLQRACGAPLDQSSSLADNGIRDGELLVLDADDSPTLGPLRRAAPQQVVGTRAVDARIGRCVPGAVCVLATTLAAAVLATTVGSVGATTYAIIAAAAAVAAFVAAVATGYETAPSICAVSLAGTTGFLAVPSGPAAPNVFLAAAAASSVSLLVLRLSGRWPPALLAVAVSSLLIAVVTVVALPLTLVGAALSATALALLALAPRVAMLAAGLGPDRWQGEVADSAAAGHAILSGLVAGCAAGAASGAVVAAVTGHAGALQFTGLVAMVLLLRCRTYVDADRRIALATGGLVSLVACLHVLVSTQPRSVGPVACLLIAVGLATVRPPSHGATLARAVDRLEYVALAAVVPMAGWVAGAYDALGGLGSS